MDFEPKRKWTSHIFDLMDYSMNLSFGRCIKLFCFSFWMTQTVYPQQTQKEELTYALTVLSLIHFLPAIVISPISGVWVDRLDRRKIMLFCDFLQGLIMLSVFFLLLFEHLNMVLLFFALLGMAALSTFHSLAFQTSYILLVPEEHLPRQMP